MRFFVFAALALAAATGALAQDACNQYSGYFSAAKESQCIATAGCYSCVSYDVLGDGKVSAPIYVCSSTNSVPCSRFFETAQCTTCKTRMACGALVKTCGTPAPASTSTSTSNAVSNYGALHTLAIMVVFSTLLA